MIRKAFLTAAFCVLASACFATATGPLTAADQKAVIDAFDQQMLKTYVFHDLAEQTASMLNSHLAAHDYDNLTDPQEFSKTISQQIRALCHDAHLRVNYSPEAIPERKKADQPTPAEIAKMKEQMRFINGGYEHAERLSGNVGYLEVRTFMDPDAAKLPLEGAMRMLQNSDALIIDLSRNGGGDPKAVSMLLSYFFDKRTHLNDFVDATDKVRETNYTTDHVSGAKYLNKPIYVVVSKRTGSAAEECAYDLQCLKRATIVGEPTWGGANPGSFFKLNEHWEAFIPEMRAMNPYTKKNWEGTGVQPDVAAAKAEALDKAHLLALNELMSKTSDPELKGIYQKAMDDIQSKK